MQALDLILTVVFVITVTGLQSTHSVPAPQAEDWFGGQINIPPEHEKRCYKLPQNIADYCGHDYTVLPNTRGHETIHKAQAEFSHFTQLLNSNCSSYLGTFLCFHYFPFSSCQENNTVPTGQDEVQYYPCRETCEEAKTPECTTNLESFGFTWAGHLECSLPEFSKSISTGCNVYGPNTRVFSPTEPTTVTVDPTEAKPNTRSPTVPTAKPTKKPNVGKEVTEEEYTSDESKTTSSPTTETPSTTSSPSTETPSLETRTTTVEAPEVTTELCECPKRQCVYRLKATGRTFKQNSYSYAAKVTVRSKFVSLGRHAYEVEVDYEYGVRTCSASGMMEKAPAMGNTTILYTNCEHCAPSPDLSSKIGSEVLVAGEHVSNSDGDVFFLTCESGKPLVSDWVKKYNKNMVDWVSKGNEDRAKSC